MIDIHVITKQKEEGVGEREREIDRQIDRQTDRQTDTGRYIDR